MTNDGTGVSTSGRTGTTQSGSRDEGSVRTVDSRWREGGVVLVGPLYPESWFRLVTRGGVRDGVQKEYFGERRPKKRGVTVVQKQLSVPY